MQAYRFQANWEYARQKDREDSLNGFRSRFYIPRYRSSDAIYFCGNSLGLQPKDVDAAIRQELQDWRELAVAGYANARTPWLTYQHGLRPPLSRIVGCLEEEVTVMNALEVNLYLLLLSFYHPTPARYRIIMEAGAFPSDQYAVETQVKFHGLDPDDAMVAISPREGEKLIREDDIIAAIERNKDSLSIVLFGGINYYTGQLFDIPAITAAAHRVGALAGFDLAHAVGNVPLQLHDWGVDFAAWCSYKYLNAGPGAVGGAYIHERYARNKDIIRMAGWWGNVEAAQVFNMVSLKASLRLFDEAGMDRIRAKSMELTSYLAYLLQHLYNISFEIITPEQPEQRGAQLSLHFPEKGKEIHQKMIDSGIIADYREPGVVWVAPTPLYNSFEDVHRFYHILSLFQ